jgi:hypothetical protein
MCAHCNHVAVTLLPTCTSGKQLSDDDYVSRREFRLLFSYLRIYATWYELFALLDGGSEGITVEDDDRLTRQEWLDGFVMLKRAAETWAPYAALKTATKEVRATPYDTATSRPAFPIPSRSTLSSPYSSSEASVHRHPRFLGDAALPLVRLHRTAWHATPPLWHRRSMISIQTTAA